VEFLVKPDSLGQPFPPSKLSSTFAYAGVSLATLRAISTTAITWQPSEPQGTCCGEGMFQTWTPSCTVACPIPTVAPQSWWDSFPDWDSWEGYGQSGDMGCADDVGGWPKRKGTSSLNGACEGDVADSIRHCSRCVVHGTCGCTDPNSPDFNPTATHDDGSCGYNSLCSCGDWVCHMHEAAMPVFVVAAPRALGGGTTCQTTTVPAPSPTPKVVYAQSAIRNDPAWKSSPLHFVRSIKTQHVFFNVTFHDTVVNVHRPSFPATFGFQTPSTKGIPAGQKKHLLSHDAMFSAHPDHNEMDVDIEVARYGNNMEILRRVGLFIGTGEIHDINPARASIISSRFTKSGLATGFGSSVTVTFTRFSQCGTPINQPSTRNGFCRYGSTNAGSLLGIQTALMRDPRCLRSGFALSATGLRTVVRVSHTSFVDNEGVAIFASGGAAVSLTFVTVSGTKHYEYTATTAGDLSPGAGAARPRFGGVALEIIGGKLTVKSSKFSKYATLSLPAQRLVDILTSAKHP
jgi:hypothetical protein